MNEVELERLEEFATKVGLYNLDLFLCHALRPEGLTNEHEIFIRQTWIAHLSRLLDINCIKGLSIGYLPKCKAAGKYIQNIFWFKVDSKLSKEEQAEMLPSAVKFREDIRLKYNCTLNYPIADYVEVLKACIEGRDWLPLFELMQSDYNKNLKKKKKSK